MATNATLDYIASAREFLARAQNYLGEGDLYQASENGWGAAAHIAKALATARGWEYERHDDFHAIVNRSQSRLRERRLWTWASSANMLHTLFYQRRTELDADAIGLYLADVQSFVDALERLTKN